MEKRRLGISDVQITPILMGTWQAGKKMWVGIEDADSIKAIRAAFEAGITTIDTAEVMVKDIQNKLSLKHYQTCAIASNMRQKFLLTI